MKWDSAFLRTKEYLIEENISIDKVPDSNGNDYSSYIGKCMPLSSSDTDMIKKNMIGLYRLLDPASISRVTAKKFKENPPGAPVKHTSDGFCLFCAYVVQNHCSLNNHIRRHLRLALFCNLGDCFFVTTDATKMWDHGKTKHEDIVHMGQAAAHFRGPC